MKVLRIEKTVPYDAINPGEQFIQGGETYLKSHYSDGGFRLCVNVETHGILTFADYTMVTPANPKKEEQVEYRSLKPGECFEWMTHLLMKTESSAAWGFRSMDLGGGKGYILRDNELVTSINIVAQEVK